MREIDVVIIKNAVAEAFISANIHLPETLETKIRQSFEIETCETAKSIFSDMLDNLKCASEMDIPVCQDCGMAVVFAEIGQDIHFKGGSFEDAVNDGVRLGYEKGYLRKSIVSDPLKRINTGDNAPAVIHTRLVPGDKIVLTAAPKGFGSENMSAIRMFNPSDTRDDIIDYIVSVVKNAGAKPCPPLVLGVGIGGDFEYCAYLAKKALCRDIAVSNPDGYYAEMEREIVSKVNMTGIGCQGFSGDITALACNIEAYPTHIAGLPVAVNVGCHVTRHKTVII